eukprot:g34292.t1
MRGDLDRLGLFSLVQRRLKEVYKIRRVRDRIDCENLFPMADMSKTRGHKFKRAFCGRLVGNIGEAATAGRVRNGSFSQRLEVAAAGTPSQRLVLAAAGTPSQRLVLAAA